MNIPIKNGDEKIIYQGKIIEVVNQEMIIGDQNKIFEFARRSPGTRLIIIKDNKILITKEYRNELDKYDYRLPGGKVFDTLTEYNDCINNKGNIIEYAKKGAIIEATEECGIKPNTLDCYTIYKCGTTIEWDLYYFIVKDFELLKGQKLELGEDISLNRMDIEETKKLCMTNNFGEERSAMILLRFLNNDKR